MVEQEEEQGARPISRFIVGVSVCCGLAADRSVSPLSLMSWTRWGCFLRPGEDATAPGGFGHCAEVVDTSSVPVTERPLIQVGPIFFGGGEYLF